MPGGNFHYGGQAVIEGVMMRGPDNCSVAVRKPDNNVAVSDLPVETITTKYPFLKWPFLRGTIVLIESLVLGIKALTYSAGQQAQTEEEELTTKEIVLTIGLALGLAILLFIVLPTALTHFFAAGVGGSFAQNLVEGVIRIAVFMAYILAVSLMPDMRRVFQYHGAEHKVINAYEAGQPLDIASIQRYKTFNPRCGTSFLLLVMVVAILVFSLLGDQVLWWKISSRILLLPVVAGISYELLKYSSKYPKSLLSKAIYAPGMFFQNMTTREPEDDQVEVAVCAFKAVLKEGEATNV